MIIFKVIGKRRNTHQKKILPLNHVWLLTGVHQTRVNMEEYACKTQRNSIVNVKIQGEGIDFFTLSLFSCGKYLI